MPNPIRRAPASFLLFLLLPAVAAATEPFEKIAGAQRSVALDPSGVREMGLGWTGVASLHPVSPGDLNPATLAWTRGVLFDYEHQSDGGFEIDDYQLMFGTSADTLLDDGWRFGGRLGYRGTTDSEPSSVPEDVFPHDGDAVFSVAAAARFTRDRVSGAAGVTARRVSFNDADLAGTDVSGWDFDVGVLVSGTYFYDDALIRPRVGVSSQHHNAGLSGGDSGSYDVSNDTRAGAGLDLALPLREFGGRNVPAIAMSFDYDFLIPQDGDSQGAFGLEWSLMDIVQIRVGLGKDADTNGAGLGWIFGGWRVRADYAHRDAGNDREAWSATIGRMF